MSLRSIIKMVIIDSQQPLYPEDLIERAPEPTFDFVFGRVKKVYTVSGLRRVGKTYYLFQIRKKLIEVGVNPKNTIFISMEDERLPARTEVLTELIPAIKELYGIDKEIYLFVDEIQRIPNWGAWVRRIHDSRKAHLFISGSTYKLSAEGIPKEFRGREENIHLLPLSFKDYLKFKGIKVNLEHIDYDVAASAKLLNAFREYLEFGGLPEVVLSPSYKRLGLLQSYFRTIISRDIVEQFRVENRAALEDFLKLLVNSPTFSISKVFNILKSIGHKVGKETLIRYLDYANKVFFIDTITIFSYKIKNRMMYPRKAYVADNGFIRALSTKYDWGRLLENMTYIELKRQIGMDPSYSIHYWRGVGNKEVDFVIVRNNEPMKLIQVSWDVSDYDTLKREVQAIIKAGKELRLDEGIIITYNDEDIIEKDGITIRILPLWKIALGLRNIF